MYKSNAIDLLEKRQLLKERRVIVIKKDNYSRKRGSVNSIFTFQFPCNQTFYDKQQTKTALTENLQSFRVGVLISERVRTDQNIPEHISLADRPIFKL